MQRRDGRNVLAICLLLCNFCTAIQISVQTQPTCNTHITCSLGVGQLYSEAVYANISHVECTSITAMAVLHYTDSICIDPYMTERREHMLNRCHLNISQIERQTPTCLRGTYESDESIAVGLFIAVAVLVPNLSR